MAPLLDGVMDAMLRVGTADQWAGGALLAAAGILVWAGTRRGPRTAASDHATSPVTTGPSKGIMRWLTPFGMPAVAAATPAPARGGTPLRIRRPAPVLQGNVNEMVARLALSGRDTAAIARQTGMARDAVQLVLLRDARTTPAATPVAAPEPAPALDRDAAARTARRDDATVRSLAEARRARTTRAVIEAVRRDPRATGVAERARVAEGRVGTRFNATVG